jgi:hypothetical protein
VGDDFDAEAWLADQAVLFERLAGQVVCDCFGLRIGDSDSISGHHWAGIYRARRLAELPTGTVEDVRLHAEEGVRDKLLLTIACARLLLIAGEIYENNDSSLGWHRFDESVLAFTSIAAADRVAWIPARTSTATRFL